MWSLSNLPLLLNLQPLLPLPKSRAKSCNFMWYCLWTNHSFFFFAWVVITKGFTRNKEDLLVPFKHIWEHHKYSLITGNIWTRLMCCLTKGQIKMCCQKILWYNVVKCACTNLNGISYCTPLVYTYALLHDCQCSSRSVYLSISPNMWVWCLQWHWAIGIFQLSYSLMGPPQYMWVCCWQKYLYMVHGCILSREFIHSFI